MAHDRNDPRDYPRDERSRWRDEPHGRRDERGFWDRAGDEISSWFGDDEAERRRREDQRMEGRGGGPSRERDWRRDEERGRSFGRDRDEERGFSGSRGYRGYGSEGSYRSSFSERETPGAERGFQPMFGGYSVSEPQGPSGYRSDYRPREWSGEAYGASTYSSRSDPHYESWRNRQLDELDRDYEDYRRENQSRFESDFGSWRERRLHKRSLLGQIREHMEVVGSDDEHVGTIDRTAGDRLILAKSDPEAGGVHHSLSCADIDRIEGDKVILDCSASDAKQRWRDESRSRALFEREDQGEMGDRALNRSFEGTYR
ncbi:MAG TPA: DUF2171 domain-containing protein [Sphingomicrobium sp.]